MTRLARAAVTGGRYRRRERAVMPDPTAILADWKAKTDAATEGPWEAECFDDEGEVQVNAGTALTEWNEAGTVGTPASSWRETDRILDRDDLYDGDFEQVSADAEFIATARTAMPALLAAVESVLRLHKPETRTAFGADGFEEGEYEACTGCWDEWPCPTVRAITDALGGGDDD